MSKIILLGGSGFVGKTLMPMLQQHKLEYVAPKSAALDLTSPNAVPLIADHVQDGDTVMMLAAYTPEKGNAGELTIKNLAMIQHVLTGIKNRDIAQFIYVSSDAVYPLTADMVDETTPTNPSDLYGQMHVMRERYVRSALAPEKVTILRPCAIYGAGDTHNAYGINRFIQTAHTQGEISLFGGGEEYRDHLYCEDMARILLASFQQRISGTCNVATGTSWRFSDIAAYIKSHVGSNVRIINKPRAQPISHRHFNTAALLRAFPSPIQSIETGMQALLRLASVAA